MSPENRRMLVATVASIAVVIFWQMIVQPKQKRVIPPLPTAQTAPASAAGTQPKQADSPEATGGSAGAAPVAPTLPQGIENAPEELIRLEGKEFVAVVSTHGGTLASIALKGQKFVEEKGGKTQPVDLVRSGPQMVRPLALIPTKENGGSGDPWTDAAGRESMRVISRDGSSVVLEGRAGSLSVRKTYRLTGKAHELALDLEVEGASGQGGASLVLAGQVPEEAKSGGLTSAPSLEMFRLVCRGGEKTERFDVTDDKPGKKIAGAVAFAGIDMHYFVAAVMPATPSGECEFFKGTKPKSGLVALTFPVGTGRATQSFTLYAGPKDLDSLRAYGRGLDTAIDYGPVTNLFAVFARGLLYVMRWMHGVTGSWGIAIILLTVVVKGVLFPLTYKSTRSMNAMRELQPEIEKLKAKYKDDREKLNQATMQMYQKHKVNPLGGCLPMLLQMPVWFALYAALQTSVELYREPFLWMKDLTLHDPYFILPVVLGISSFAMQKLSPQPADNAQAKMMLYFLPIFFSAIMVFVPGGLTLYIVINNLLTIAQTRAIAASTATPTAAKS